MLNYKFFLFTIIFFLPVISIAQNNNYKIEPFALRTPQTLEQGQLDLNIKWNKGWFYDSNDLRVTRVPIRLTYGWSDRLNLDFEFPWQEDFSDTNGISYYEIGTKFKVLDRIKYFPAFALRGAVAFGGDKKLFESFGTSRFSLEALFYLDLFGGEGYMNVGYTWRNDADNFTINNTPNWSIAYQRPLGEHSLVEGSVSYRSQLLPSVEPGRFPQEAEDAMEFIMAIHYKPIERLTLSFSGGLGTLEGSPDAKLAAGVNVSLGRIALTKFEEAAPLEKKEKINTSTEKIEPQPFKNETLEEKKETATPHSPYKEALNTAQEAYQNGKYKDAIKYFQKSLEYDKTSIEAYNGLGNSYYILREFNRAADAYKKAIELEIPSKSADLHFNLGLCLYQLGKKDKAKDEWEKTLEIDPNHTAAKENLEALQ